MFIDYATQADVATYMGKQAEDMPKGRPKEKSIFRLPKMQLSISERNTTAARLKFFI
jgi:hypothetical protein